MLTQFCIQRMIEKYVNTYHAHVLFPSNLEFAWGRGGWKELQLLSCSGVVERGSRKIGSARGSCDIGWEEIRLLPFLQLRQQWYEREPAGLVMCAFSVCLWSSIQQSTVFWVHTASLRRAYAYANMKYALSSNPFLMDYSHWKKFNL